jgi:hypothetical protein
MSNTETKLTVFSAGWQLPADGKPLVVGDRKAVGN